MKNLEQLLKKEIIKHPNQFNVIISYMIPTEKGEQSIFNSETIKNTKHQTSKYIFRYINTKRIL